MPKVIVGLSGGVDSSVAAMLLKEQGYQVEGLFMKNWEDDDDKAHCSADLDVADARLVAEKLQIPFHTVNFAEQYWDNVFTHFLKEYSAGRTPNPDILCNQEIKFKAFLDYALALGADYIATGHYARITYENNHYHLLQGIDKNKDQSYFLYTLKQHQLSKSLFPLGDLNKENVRVLAKKAGFLNHNKKDSTGICFIGERKFKEFLNQYLPAQPGDIVTVEDKVIGRHDGLMFYTIGQRKGLKIGGLQNTAEAPWYVVDKDLPNNRLIVAQGHNHPRLLADRLVCHSVSWTLSKPETFPLPLEAKTRYRQRQQSGQLTCIDHDNYQLQFLQPQWAITPGQSVVFYQGEHCLGGGIISSIASSSFNGN